MKHNQYKTTKINKKLQDITMNESHDRSCRNIKLQNVFLQTYLRASRIALNYDNLFFWVYQT